MPFTAIAGSFHVRGYSPDGDSIRFAPRDPELLGRLSGPRPKVNPRGHVQLRIEGIDALETHYTPPSGGGVYHQPDRWANAATDRLLAFAGISDVTWDRAHKTVLDASDGSPGYILSRATEKYGRPIAFVFAGDPPEADGAEVFLDPARMEGSYNNLALKEGLAYPTFYNGLFADLRTSLTEATVEARQAHKGLWQQDATEKGFDATDLSVITGKVCILPKLFRRLSEYMVNFGTALGFKAKLQQSREPVLDLRDHNFTHFDTFIEQDDDSTAIRMTRHPEELVFDEMPARPANHFSSLVGGATAEPPRFVRVVGLPVEVLQDVPG